MHTFEFHEKQSFFGDFSRSLDVECRLKNSDQDLKYKCRQFPGQIVPGEARYEVVCFFALLAFRASYDPQIYRLRHLRNGNIKTGFQEKKMEHQFSAMLF